MARTDQIVYGVLSFNVVLIERCNNRLYGYLVYMYIYVSKIRYAEDTVLYF